MEFYYNLEIINHLLLNIIISNNLETFVHLLWQESGVQSAIYLCLQNFPRCINLIFECKCGLDLHSKSYTREHSSMEANKSTLG